ncbi:AAA family ATPase [Desulfobacterales bacterium HSG17]|nr:AAA family ATPase [Desulfobacterales bacterium HSG17]
MSDFFLPAIRVRGYRPFRDVLFRFNRLEVIIGANGSGKTSLFDFLKLLRDSCNIEIPHEFITGKQGQKVFHQPGEDKIFWNVQIDCKKTPLFYQGEIEEDKGLVKVAFERIITKKSIDKKNPGGFTFLDFRNGMGLVRDPDDGDFLRKEWNLGKNNQLGLGAVTDANLTMLYKLREYIRNWRFYNGSKFNSEKIRRPVPDTCTQLLDEDAGNLSAIIFKLMTEHSEAFEDLKSLIQFAIPGFKNLEARQTGINGEVFTFWQEDGVETELNFADLSDGILRFIAWSTLCVMPSPPSLICIDDPVQGLHPRTLPVLAGLFEKASERTQVLLATHASYFLTQFDMENIAILKKTSGGSVYTNVRHSPAILNHLQQIEDEELQQMHRADELEGMF